LNNLFFIVSLDASSGATVLNSFIEIFVCELFDMLVKLVVDADLTFNHLKHVNNFAFTPISSTIELCDDLRNDLLHLCKTTFTDAFTGIFSFAFETLFVSAGNVNTLVNIILSSL